MATARRRDAWERTAWVLAMIANCNRDPKKKATPYTPDDFNPMAARTKAAEPTVSVADLKTMFGRGKGQGQP